MIVAKTPLLAEDGTVTGIASVVTDISEQKRTAAVLENARACRPKPPCRPSRASSPT